MVPAWAMELGPELVVLLGAAMAVASMEAAEADYQTPS